MVKISFSSDEVVQFCPWWNTVRHGVPEWGSSRKISNGLDLTVDLSRFKNFRQVLKLRSWEFSCVRFAFRRCGKFQNVERDRENRTFDLVKGLEITWQYSKTTWHTAKTLSPPVLKSPPTLDLHCLIRREAFLDCVWTDETIVQLGKHRRIAYCKATEKHKRRKTKQKFPAQVRFRNSSLKCINRYRIHWKCTGTRMGGD